MPERSCHAREAARSQVVLPVRLPMRYQERVAGSARGQTGQMPTTALERRVRRARIPLPAQRPARVVIEDPQPVVDGGRYRAKRCIGDRVEVSATIFRDGHDALRALACYRRRGERRWRTVPMARSDAAVGGDRWAGRVRGRRDRPLGVAHRGLHRPASRPGATSFSASSPRARPELDSELAEGVAILEAVAARARGADRARPAPGRRAHARRAACDRGALPRRARADARAGRRAHRRTATTPPSGHSSSSTSSACGRASAAWYELFPRSWGGFEGVERTLPQFAALGIDVLYFPPIHPIGVTARKGRNDAPHAGPGDPGSPWAIGSADGGHTAVHPDLGTIEDFERLVAAAHREGLEIALDFAIQCSADHPWLTEHPEWFRRRPDGTLKYAENPPKRYRDIYNVDFDCEDWRGLWRRLRDVVLYWVARGVHIFRVDNPHTKPLAFWEWLIESVRAVDPAVVFLSEAFTRETMMHALAKVGFSQSYTYFTWKNTRWELARVRARAGAAADARLLPSQLLRQHPGHPQRLPADIGAGRASRRG